MIKIVFFKIKIENEHKNDFFRCASDNNLFKIPKTNIFIKICKYFDIDNLVNIINLMLMNSSAKAKFSIYYAGKCYIKEYSIDYSFKPANQDAYINIFFRNEIDGIDLSFRKASMKLGMILNGNHSLSYSNRLLLQRTAINKINNIKLFMNENDHNPPHYHIIGPDIDYVIRIKGFKIINKKGKISNQDLKKIKNWHYHNEKILLDKWEDNKKLTKQ